MQDQGLAAAGGHPISQFGKIGFSKYFVGRLAGGFGGVAFADKGIQIGKKLGTMIEITIQNNFCVKHSQILKIPQGNRLSASAVNGRKMGSNVLIVSFEVFYGNFDLTATAYEMVAKKTPT
jgi:hypothetical protein